MVFSSVVFLCVFLPLVLLLYYICPRRLRNAVLLLVSLVFYAWGEPVYVLIMLLSTLFNYICGLLIDWAARRGRHGVSRFWIILSCVGSLGVLGLFKYADFLISAFNSVTGAGLSLLGLALPIGISFYTFQTLSYTIDVYRGDVKVQKNFIDFAAYVTLFPQLIAGPIVRYQDVQYELAHRRESAYEFSEGVHRFVLGLAKKVILANRAGALYQQIDTQNLTAGGAWLGAVLFAFQIYFDFSGYSDMAIGLGHMFGFKFCENFNDPYTSVSITDFWRRWHISLGTWFREYLYIPLGGNRKGIGRQLINVGIVWLLTGLWHGASWNFVLWGAWFGVLLMIEKLFLLRILKKIPAFFGHVYTLFCVLISWVIFANEDLSVAFSWLGTMFGSGSGWDTQTTYMLLTHAVLILICVFFCTALPKRISTALYSRSKNAYLILRFVFTSALLIVCMAFLVSETYNPFLYFRF